MRTIALMVTMIGNWVLGQAQTKPQQTVLTLYAGLGIGGYNSNQDGFLTLSSTSEIVGMSSGFLKINKMSFFNADIEYSRRYGFITGYIKNGMLTVPPSGRLITNFNTSELIFTPKYNLFEEGQYDTKLIFSVGPFVGLLLSADQQYYINDTLSGGTLKGLNHWQYGFDIQGSVFRDSPVNRRLYSFRSLRLGARYNLSSYTYKGDKLRPLITAYLTIELIRLYQQVHHLKK